MPPRAATAAEAVGWRGTFRTFLLLALCGAAVAGMRWLLAPFAARSTLRADTAACGRVVDEPDRVVRLDGLAGTPFTVEDPRLRAASDPWRVKLAATPAPLLARYLDRMRRYESLLLFHLRRRGMPAELRYVALAESGLRVRARSGAGAVGLWQLRPVTARAYGLRVDGVVDQRTDPVAATRAATAYLSDLHERFGSWELALAAYNLGPTRLARRMRASGAAGYGDLVAGGWLPRETAAYVPRLMALIAVAEARREQQRWHDVGTGRLPAGTESVDLASRSSLVAGERGRGAG